MARKKGGGTQLYGIVTALEKGRQHRGGTEARRRVVKASSSIGRGCAQNYTSLMSFCNSRTGTLRGIGGFHILLFEYRKVESRSTSRLVTCLGLYTPG